MKKQVKTSGVDINQGRVKDEERGDLEAKYGGSISPLLVKRL